MNLIKLQIIFQFHFSQQLRTGSHGVTCDICTRPSYYSPLWLPALHLEFNISFQLHFTTYFISIAFHYISIPFQPTIEESTVNRQPWSHLWHLHQTFILFTTVAFAPWIFHLNNKNKAFILTRIFISLQATQPQYT